MVFEIESKDHLGVKLIAICNHSEDSLWFTTIPKKVPEFTSHSTLLIRFDPDFDSTKGLVTTVTTVFKNFQNTTAGHGRDNHVVTKKSHIKICMHRNLHSSNNYAEEITTSAYFFALCLQWVWFVVAVTSAKVKATNKVLRKRRNF